MINLPKGDLKCLGSSKPRSVKFLRVSVHTGVQKQRTKQTGFFFYLLYDFKQKNMPFIFEQDR